MHQLKLWIGQLTLAGMAFTICLNAVAADNNKLALNLMYQRILPSIVSITVLDNNGDLRRGSGFYVDSNGLFVTSFATVDNATRVTVRSHDGWLLEVKDVIALSKPNDLALLRAPIHSSRPLNLMKPDTSLMEGYPAIAIGSAQGLSWSITSGIVSGPATQSANHTDPIEFTAPLSPGNRGGPLINQFGQVIGVIQTETSASATPSNNLAIHAEHVRALMVKINAMPLSATWTTQPPPAVKPLPIMVEKETGPDEDTDEKANKTEQAIAATVLADLAAAIAQEERGEMVAAPVITAPLGSAESTPPADEKKPSAPTNLQIQDITQVKKVAWGSVQLAQEPGKICPPEISQHLQDEFGIQTVSYSKADAVLSMSGELDTAKECNMWGCFDGYRLHVDFSITNRLGKTLFSDVFDVDEDDVYEACEELAEDIVDEVEDFL